MKKFTKLLSFVLCFSFLFSTISFAADTGNITENSNAASVMYETIGSENNLENAIAAVENKYDMTTNMPEDAIKELSSVAEVSKEEQWLDETHLQVSYNLVSKDPVLEKKFKSGNTEELYSITNYTYVMTLADSSGSQTDTSVQSDVTIKNTVYYNYFDDGPVRMLKIDYGTTTITRFLESGLRNLVLHALAQGVCNNGYSDEYKTRTIPTPYVNSNYSLDTRFNNYCHTGGAKILYGAEVTYSHGNSSYTARAQISLGS